MKAEEFDKIFDDNEEDIIEHLDLSTIRRPNLEAKHIGVSCQAIIKTWLADKIMQVEHHKVVV